MNRKWKVERLDLINEIANLLRYKRNKVFLLFKGNI
jgi:hypothetical protein